ncbi:MAG: hypothetical protein M3Q48_09055, partial [Actinomycetota bacterium]|nr:hypothetical protein [Actinomycetota bacterium]
LEHWRELDPMPNAARATVDDRKFTEYSMDPEGNHKGKHEAFAKLGYDVSAASGRRSGADHVIQQVRQQLARLPARPRRPSMGLGSRSMSPSPVPMGKQGHSSLCGNTTAIPMRQS